MSGDMLFGLLVGASVATLVWMPLLGACHAAYSRLRRAEEERQAARKDAPPSPADFQAPTPRNRTMWSCGG